MQPSAPIAWYEIPFPDWTTSMLPLSSNLMDRGRVNPPATLVAFHPLARTPWYEGLPAPEQEAGMAAPALLVPVALTLVTTVLAGGTAVALAVGVVSNKLLFTNCSKLSMRAALRSWVQCPTSACTLNAVSFRVGFSTAEVPKAQANWVVPVPFSTYLFSSTSCQPVHPLHKALTVQ